MRSINTYTSKVDTSLFGIGSNVRNVLTSWIEDAKDKKAAAEAVRSIMNEPYIENPNVDKMLDELAKKYKYKDHDLGDYFGSSRGQENLADIAWDILDKNKLLK